MKQRNVFSVNIYVKTGWKTQQINLWNREQKRDRCWWDCRISCGSSSSRTDAIAYEVEIESTISPRVSQVRNYHIVRRVGNLHGKSLKASPWACTTSRNNHAVNTKRNIVIVAHIKLHDIVFCESLTSPNYLIKYQAGPFETIWRPYPLGKTWCRHIRWANSRARTNLKAIMLS